MRHIAASRFAADRAETAEPPRGGGRRAIPPRSGRHLSRRGLRAAWAAAALAVAAAGLAVTTAAAQSLPEVSVQPYRLSGVSDGDTIRFAFAVAPAQSSNFDISVSVGGMNAAAFGVTAGNRTVTIPANQRFGYLEIATTDIDPTQAQKNNVSATERAQSNGYVSVTIQANARYRIDELAGYSVAEVRVYDFGEIQGPQHRWQCNQGEGRITDCSAYTGWWDTGPSVTVEIEALDTTVVEGQPARFRVKATPFAGRNLRIAVSLSHSLDDAFDNRRLHDLRIRLSRYSHGRYARYSYITVPTVDDDADDPDGRIVLTIEPYRTLTRPQQPYTVGSSGSASVTVTDNDEPVPDNRVPEELQGSQLSPSTTTTPTVAPPPSSSSGSSGSRRVQAPDKKSPSAVFSDLGDAPSAHRSALRSMSASGVFAGLGCGGGRLCPNEAIPRWEMAVALVRVVDGQEPAAVRSSRFSDVAAGRWWAAHTERLAGLGVTAGCATGPLRYCPDDTVTRAQTASFLKRAFSLPAAVPAGFADTAGSVHEADIDALYAAGITAGCSTGPLKYCPGDTVTRAQMASFLSRAVAHRDRG